MWMLKRSKGFRVRYSRRQHRWLYWIDGQPVNALLWYREKNASDEK